jgi:ADP-heptose:LPS heptosyltransferase
MGGGVIYLKRKNKYNHTTDQFEALRRLLLTQDYITDVLPYPETDFFQYVNEIDISYDLDIFRKATQVKNGRHLIESNLLQLGIVDDNWHKPILKLKNEYTGKPYAVINRTVRHQDNFIDWKFIVENLLTKYNNRVYFIGNDEDYVQFVVSCGKKIERRHTKDLLEAAQLIKGSDILYCNQSVCLTIAQLMGHDYLLEAAPNHTNCIIEQSKLL